VEITEIINGDNNVLDTVLNFVYEANSRIDACVDYTRPALAMNIEKINDSILDAKRRGIEIRCITEIVKDNLSNCKDLLTIVDGLRHIDGIKGTFYVSNEQYLAPSLVHDKDKPTSQMIRSNVREIIEQHQYLFETLWNKAILGEQKINEIENGIPPDTIEILYDGGEALKLAHKLMRSSEKEILAVLPSSKVFLRQVRLGGVDIVLEAAARNVVITILTPLDENAKILAQQLENQSKNIRVQEIEPSSHITISALIVDRKHSLAVELRDDSKLKISESAGIATYSTSKSTVMSYVSMFESLTRLTELYEESQAKLMDSTEELGLECYQQIGII
jgi:hypothetical protein